MYEDNSLGLWHLYEVFQTGKTLPYHSSTSVIVES